MSLFRCADFSKRFLTMVKLFRRGLRCERTHDNISLSFSWSCVLIDVPASWSQEVRTDLSQPRRNA